MVPPSGAAVCDDVAVTDAPAVAAPGHGPAGRRSAQLPLAVITVLAGAMLVGGSYVGPVGLLVIVALVQAALVVGWVFGTGLPGRIGGLLMGLGAAAASDALVSRWTDQGYAPVLGVLGLAVPAMFVHQLTRGVVRSRVVESLADITLLLVGVTGIAGLILLRHQINGDVTAPAVIGSLAAALLAAHITDSVMPAPRVDSGLDRGIPAVLAGVLVGAGVGLLSLRRVIDFTGGRGAFVGAAVGAVGCLVSIGASFVGSHSTLAVSTPEVSITVAGFDDPELTARRAGVARLQPVAAVLMTIGLTAPAGYLLITALSG